MALYLSIILKNQKTPTVMLLEFSVGNFRSFNKKKTLSLEATKAIKDEPRNNYFKEEGYSVLRSLAVYGANSSGKSNLVRAMNVMRTIVLNSVKLNDKEDLPYDPFLLSVDTIRSTHFEVMFLIDHLKYRYGFEYTQNKIEEEWLFISKGKKKENALFVRSSEGIGVNEKYFQEGISLEERTNDNRLFISLVGQLGGEISKKIINWFSVECQALSGIESDAYKLFSKLIIRDNEECGQMAIRFFKDLQLGFQSLFASEKEFSREMLSSEMPTELKLKLEKDLAGKRILKLHSTHNKYNKTGKIVGEASFDIEERESDGTNKLIELAGPIFDTLLNGRTLFIDELDAKMHPLISEYIIKLFNNPETNPHNAQLIFTTHDTHLLSANLLRRDQIWFTEKDSVEQTDLYSMIDILLPNGQKPRNDSNYEKNYIAGRYGAIPFIQ